MDAPMYIGWMGNIMCVRAKFSKLMEKNQLLQVKLKFRWNIVFGSKLSEQFFNSINLKSSYRINLS